MSAPPSLAGAVKAIDAEVFPGVAELIVGAPGTVAGVTLAESDAAPAPTPAEPAPAPAPVEDNAPAQNALPFETPAPAFTIDLPLPPTAQPAAKPRLIGRAPADSSALRARAAQIAPLLARLEVVRARMHG